ncbi:outer membrane protein assembly factor BamB family protein [Rhodococcoides kyotonense]|uniref:PQQ-like domain-containing protein n=1 Tax=Rhodococcoides kyotonense TaxID=398843 RepID=A0A239IJY4_9NOCA|nr:PQQ-binding-like beta-propeller repeat protein [Rhodococcus kyotonensis]SNS93548.1 PQQ-like domain-containing protein [Rhodococcus kyotonensis]
MKPRTQLAIAGLVTVVSVSAATVFLAQDRTATIKRITDATPGAPGLAWALDASASGLNGATFSDPRSGSEYPWGVGAIRIDDTLFTLAVVGGGDGPNTDAVMVAVDVDSGTVRWTAPAQELATCADEPLDGALVCQRVPYLPHPGLITYDIASGESRTVPSSPDAFAITVAEDRLYTAEGNLEDADVRLHRGTLERPDADWSAPVTASGGWEDQYADRLKVDTEIGQFDIGGQFASFDAATGKEVWSTDILDDCVIAKYRSAGDLAVATEFDCAGDSSDVTATRAYTSDGDVLVSHPGPVEHYLAIDDPTDASVPVVLGDAAFDRTSGEELWRSDLLIFDDPGDEWNDPRIRGTLGAVIGEVGLLSRDGTTIGIDLNSGEELWRAPERWSIIGSDGDTVLASESGHLNALDSLSGELLWSAEYSKMIPDGASPDTLIEGADGSYTLMSGSTLARLIPLP